MAKRLRQFVAPTYLLLCLLAGGSAQGIWANMGLQLVGLGLIAWAALERPANKPLRPARQLMWIVGLALGWVALQLVPLPPSVWSALGPRAKFLEAYDLLGIAAPALPLSVAPYATLAAVLTMIPPIALYVAIERLHAYRASFLVAALIGGTIAGIALGALQVASPDPNGSPYYLYRDVNFGVGTGFFANANHMATLLLCALPFLAAVAASARASGRQQSAAVAIAAVALALLVAVGIAINGSLAAYVLFLPVAAASALIVIKVGAAVRRGAIVAALLLLVGGVAVLNFTAIGGSSIGAEAAGSVQSRQEILATTTKAMRAYMPLGSGLGTFRPVFDSFEDPDRVTPTYSSHAHNDYAELALELGLPGVFLLLLFFYWWGKAAMDSWRSPESQPYVRAAVIASGAILAHSMVDYPLRTAAIASLFAMSLAFLADRVKSDRLEPSDLRPTRHVSLD
ncbi:MAG: O-antigen ligase family protein [Pseudomonadota bacterium]